jgi:RNA polymerase sigma-70 factor, ECF subfamily
VVCLTSADTVLVLRCQEDDYDAFDEIVAKYKDGIFNYIRRMISNPDDVEDLAQEVFVRAFTSIKTFRRESNLRTWLYRIATNLCVDKYRRGGIEKQILSSMEFEDGDEWKTVEPPDETYNPEHVYERTELQAEVQNALSKLPDKLRATVLLYDIEGMTYDEIAEALGCPMGTVKSRLFNARIQLKDLLKPYMEGG